MRVAILQSNYFPWRGYFSIINSVDLFVFHDDLQYTKGDWRNRNLFVNSNGHPTWLTVPVGDSEGRLICDVELPQNGWEKMHHQRISDWYSREVNLQDHNELLEEVYLNNKFKSLSDFNQFWIKYIAEEKFESNTEFIDSRSLNLTQTKSKRVMEILTKVGATSYLSGPAARDYLIENDFLDERIELEYADYKKLPPLEAKDTRPKEFSILHDLLRYPSSRPLIGML